MLTAEENELLTQTGPGTLMGNLLRRYWTPALLSSELPNPDDPPVRVRLMGEDLVAFRDSNGKVGLVANHCPHRGASVFFGRNEECGLRCVYHGWKFDVDGNCVDMPNEPATSNFKDKVKILAYPTHESGGIVWTYMGPSETMTPFRDFGTETLPKELVVASKEPIDCNWVQSLEGNIDSAHISFLHSYFVQEEWPDDGTDRPGYCSPGMGGKIQRFSKHPRFEVNDEWYGYRYAALRETPNGYTQARVTVFTMPNQTIIASAPYRTDPSALVPVDDERCLRFHYQNQLAPPDVRPKTGAVRSPYGPHVRDTGGIVHRDYTLANDYQIDREAQRHVSFSGIYDFASQDFMVTETMGPIYDRSSEHLGSTDAAIIRMREMLIRAARAVASGEPAPVTGAELDYRSIRSAEKILDAGEDWRVLGTNDDPIVRTALVVSDEG